MVLGLFRRRKGGNPPVAEARPMGEDSEDGYVPTQEELARAEPIPPVGEWWNPEDVGLTWEEAGWPLVARHEWKPRRARSYGRYFRDVLWLPGYKLGFHGMVWANGRIYLVDGATLSILHEADGTKTAYEIVEKVATSYIEYLPDDDSLKTAFTKENPSEDEKKEVRGFFSALFFQMALLKKKGLLS